MSLKNDNLLDMVKFMILYRVQMKKTVNNVKQNLIEYDQLKEKKSLIEGELVLLQQNQALAEHRFKLEKQALELEESTFRNVQHDFFEGMNPVLEQAPMEIKQSNFEPDEQTKARKAKLELDMHDINKEIKKTSRRINLAFILLQEIELDCDNKIKESSEYNRIEQEIIRRDEENTPGEQKRTDE